MVVKLSIANETGSMPTVLEGFSKWRFWLSIGNTDGYWCIQPSDFNRPFHLICINRMFDLNNFAVRIGFASSLCGIVLLLGGCSSENVDSPVQKLKLAEWEAPEPVVVELFAPGVVNSTWPEFGISFTASGDTAYFDRTIKDRSQLAIMRTVRLDGVWQNPEVAPFSGHFFDVDPFVVPGKGSGVFFSSRQIDPDRGGVYSFDHWFWSGQGEPIRLPRPLSSDGNEYFLTATLDGTLFFSSDRSSASDIYISRIIDGMRVDPEIVTIPNTESPGNPLVTPDGKTLVFQNDLFGASKIVFSCRTDSGWTEPLLLPRAINSAYVDFAPAMHPDGTFFFTSERPGMVTDVIPGQRPPGDIYTTNVNVNDFCGTL